MKAQLVIMAATLACTGCVAYSLERRTVNQSLSVTDIRYQQVLECLAVVAANPGILPSYTMIADGTAQVTDTANLYSQTLWNRTVNSFATETLQAYWSRNPLPNWTVDPVADHDQLEALRCACRWVLDGPDAACEDCAGVLASPQQDKSPGPHFDVAWRLIQLPPCWLHVGRAKEVPAHACYKAHCHGTWVWVMPDGMEGLSQFTLVFQDIATRVSSSMSPPRITVDLIRPDKKNMPRAVNGERRSIKPEYVQEFQSQLFDPNVSVANIDWENLTEPADSTALRTNVSPSGGGSSPALQQHIPGYGAQNLQFQNLRSMISASKY